jgi:hypothetical protein
MSGKSSPLPSYYGLLRGVLSADRLDAYHQPGDSDGLDAAARYLWNVALSEALYPALAALEVGLRNNFHDELAATAAPLDRFPTVYAQGSSVYRAGLEALCRRHGYAP